MSKAQFHDDTDYSRRSSFAKLRFIYEHKELLLKRRNGAKHLAAMDNISAFPDKAFRPKQMSYIDDVYEMVMRELGFPSYKGQKSKYGVNLK